MSPRVRGSSMTAARGSRPLWDTGSARLPGHRAARAISAPLAPLVTASLPEDAAWEGFVTPASRGNNAICLEYHGKLVMQNSGVAGSVVARGLSTWTGTHFEPLPPLNTLATALGVWNDQLIVAGGSSPFPILRLNGTVWDTLGTADNVVWVVGEYQGDLVVGGRFTSVGGISAPLVAAFDGTDWSAAGAGMSGFEVTGLTIHVGGLVAAIRASALKGVVSLGALGGVWQTVGAGFTGIPYYVVSDGTYLYACGD
jgi:hypothetical protein